MNDKTLTKKVLAEVADDLSKTMDFETPIETGDKATKANIITDLKEAGKELLPTDVISDQSREVLIFLKVKLPKPEEPVSDKTEKSISKTEAKKATKAAEKDKKIEPKPPKETKKSEKYTRAQAFCDALQGNPKTIEEIAKRAISLYEEKTGKTGTQIKTAIWNVTLSLQPLLILGFVEKTDKKYLLK